MIELAPQAQLREWLALAGAYAFHECDPNTLRNWLRAPGFKAGMIPRVFLFLSSVCVLVLGILALVGFLPWHFVFPYLLPPLVAQSLFGLAFMQRVRPVLNRIATLAGEITVLKDGLALMSRHRFASEKLIGLAASISPEAVSQMKALQRLAVACEQRRKDVIFQFSLFLCFGTQLALAIECWRARYGAELAVWLTVFAEFDALNAIACYTHEHPDYTFPEFVEDAVLFHAENLGDPLLPIHACVLNHLHLDRELAFCLVSGSNMAGKSTWLRAVGLAAVLAAAGAPLRATRARMSLFSVCASISIVDSLVAGKSKFLAEVERLRITIHTALHQPPVLFLIDEILSGTNSADRREVAESVLDVLVSAGAVGLLSTHDSTLVSLAEPPRLHGRNVHMGNETSDDPLEFDYLIKPGPVRQTNALAISRMVGITCANCLVPPHETERAEAAQSSCPFT